MSETLVLTPAVPCSYCGTASTVKEAFRPSHAGFRWNRTRASWQGERDRLPERYKEHAA